MSESNLLTDAELRSIEIEVQKEIDKELKDKEKARVKKELLQQARKERDLIEPREDVLIDLPPDGSRILVNNRAYQYGQTYNVPRSVAIMLRHTMQSAWEHQAQIEGRSKDFFRKQQRLTRMSARTEEVSNAPQSPGGLRV